jgi:hypothetical protein
VLMHGGRLSGETHSTDWLHRALVKRSPIFGTKSRLGDSAKGGSVVRDKVDVLKRERERERERVVKLLR